VDGLEPISFSLAVIAVDDVEAWTTKDLAPEISEILDDNRLKEHAAILTQGTVVKFRSINEINGHLSAPAMGMADGTHVVTDPGAGITHLSWLVISH